MKIMQDILQTKWTTELIFLCYSVTQRSPGVNIWIMYNYNVNISSHVSSTQDQNMFSLIIVDAYSFTNR